VNEIRPARPADAAALAALSGQLGYPSTAEAMQRRLAVVLGTSDSLVLVGCTDGDEPLGWIHVGERQLLEADSYCEILGLVIDSRHRRQGWGARLVAAAERWAAERGHAQMAVRSNIARAESHPFYEGIGYTRVKTQHVYRKVLDLTPSAAV
jgi:ribosomal protein S18 acetylase RimI-like enzyme